MTWRYSDLRRRSSGLAASVARICSARAKAEAALGLRAGIAPVPEVAAAASAAKASTHGSCLRSRAVPTPDFINPLRQRLYRSVARPGLDTHLGLNGAP